MSVRRPGPLGQLAVLLGLTGFAVSQPVLAVTGEDPTFFLLRRVGPAGIVAFALAVALVPPLALWALGRAAGRLHPAAGTVVHRAAVAVLLALATLQLVKQLGAEAAAVQVAAALAAATTGTALYVRSATVATWARYTAILPPLAVGAFLFTSPVSALLDDGGGSASAAASRPAADHPSAVVLVLDELPTRSLLAADGSVDAGRFPGFAELAATSSWYPRFTGAASLTEFAVPALLTGNPPRDVAPVASEYPDNLFTLLAPTHRVEASEAVTALCPPAVCEPGARPGLVQQVGRALRGGARAWQDRVTPGHEPETRFEDGGEPAGSGDGAAGAADWEAGPGRFRHLLDTLEAPDEPTLWYLHLLLPHSPWRLLPDGRTYDWQAFPYSHNHTAGIAALNEARHLLQLQYTDRLIGELLDRLRAEAMLDDVLLVVVGDHGASFTAGVHARDWDDRVADQLTHTPLFVKHPGQSGGGVEPEPLTAVDLVPTIADALGLDVPWETTGAPAGSAEVAGRDGDATFTFPAPPTTVRFDRDRAGPEAATRHTPPSRPGEQGLDLLFAALGVEDLVGRPLPPSSAEGALAGSIAGLADLERGSDAVAVTGRVPGARPDDLVLLTLDGAVVSASPVFGRAGDEDGDHFGALVPSGALERGGRLGLAVRRDDRILPVDVER